jgi:hypothetical protein
MHAQMRSDLGLKTTRSHPGREETQVQVGNDFRRNNPTCFRRGELWRSRDTRTCGIALVETICYALADTNLLRHSLTPHHDAGES